MAGAIDAPDRRQLRPHPLAADAQDIFRPITTGRSPYSAHSLSASIWPEDDPTDQPDLDAGDWEDAQNFVLGDRRHKRTPRGAPGGADQPTSPVFEDVAESFQSVAP